MKKRVIRSLILFLVPLGFASSCFNPPEFSVVPQIEFEDIYFGDHPDIVVQDSLVITIRFKDGDGNLGLSDDKEYPFQSYNFFVDKDGELFNVYELDAPEPGMKLTRKSSYKKGINGMRPFESPDDCRHYLRDSVLVPVGWKSIIDATYTIDTMKINGDTVFKVKDTLYVEANPRHFNIDVTFLVKGPTDTDFKEFVWPLPVGQNWPECPEGFNAQFPFIDKDNGTPTEGTISYTMQSVGYRAYLGNSLIKLRVKIRDRAGNESNEVVTPEFTLETIRR